MLCLSPFLLFASKVHDWRELLIYDGGYEIAPRPQIACFVNEILCVKVVYNAFISAWQCSTIYRYFVTNSRPNKEISYCLQIMLLIIYPKVVLKKLMHWYFIWKYIVRFIFTGFGNSINKDFGLLKIPFNLIDITVKQSLNGKFEGQRYWYKLKSVRNRNEI